MRCLHGPQPEYRARQVVSGVLTHLGMDKELGDVEQAIQELVTNARKHAPRPYELRIYISYPAASHPVVTVAVVDGGTDHAAVTRRLAEAAAGVPSLEESGRGLQMVTALFPGSCGAGPALTCPGRVAAKQVWISTPLPGQLAAGPVAIRATRRC
jgi:anti-sigma regulatory factor (Ser/Thr protein kinase)